MAIPSTCFDFKQTWVVDATWELLFVDEVKGHLKSHIHIQRIPHALIGFNQTWVIDATWKPSFVDEVAGHIPRSKVMLKDSSKM